MSKVRFIDIVRVLGLLLVLTYHLFQDVLPGGFLGVDVFFTFSGYLITSLIISTFTKDGNFSFVSFIKRRFSRTFPVLFFSLIFTLPFTKLLPNDFTANIDKQITAALGFVTNYFEILSGGSYEARLIPHLYVHTWSLAIEFQYYIIWGTLAALFSFVFSKCLNKNRLFKVSILMCSVALGLLSYFNMQHLFLSNKNSSIAYWDSTSHVYSFFIGSILGVLFGLKLSDKLSQTLKKLSLIFKILSVILIPAILVTIFKLCCNTTFENIFTYKYGFLIISVLTLMLILITRILHEIISEKFKDSILISHIANISYAMYLFHWPFYIIFSNIIASNLVSAISTIVCSYILSVFTVYTVEPIFYKSRYSTNNISLKTNIIITSLLSAICIYFSYDVIANKQIISTLQEEQMVGNVIQNIDKIKHLEQSINNLNNDPLLQNNLKTPEISDVGDTLQSDDSLTNDKSSSDSSSSQTEATESDSSSSQTEATESDTPSSQTEATKSDTPSSQTEAAKFDTPSNLEDSDDSIVSSSQAETTESNDPSNQTKELHYIPANITIIGDSVTLGARKKLLESIPNSYVDAKGSRSLNAGYDIFHEMQRTNTSGEYVVIALGTNGIPAFAKYIQKFIDELYPGQRLIFVTPYDGRWTETWNSYKTTQYLRSIENKYDFVTIADWAKIVSSNPSIVGSDKIHIGGYKKGIQAFTDNISSAIEIAANKKAK